MLVSLINLKFAFIYCFIFNFPIFATVKWPYFDALNFVVLTFKTRHRVSVFYMITDTEAHVQQLNYIVIISTKYL